MNNLQKEVTEAVRLISLPKVYLRLRTILDDPDYSMADVASVISSDPGLTMRLLRLVNSSLYGFSKKIETVSRAISLLGTHQVHDLVLATAVAQTFEGMPPTVVDVQKFWRSSVYCGVSARRLAFHFPGCDKERLFVAGLLHEIGHLIMYQAIPELCQRAIETAAEHHIQLFQAERSLLGFDYGDIGCEIMEQWSLPESLKEITKFHVEPWKTSGFPLEVALVYLGVLLTKEDCGEGVFNEDLLAVDPSVWTVTGLGPKACTSLTEKVEEEVLEVMSLLSS